MDTPVQDLDKEPYQSKNIDTPQWNICKEDINSSNKKNTYISNTLSNKKEGNMFDQKYFKEVTIERTSQTSLRKTNSYNKLEENRESVRGKSE